MQIFAPKELTVLPLLGEHRNLCSFEMFKKVYTTFSRYRYSC